MAEITYLSLETPHVGHLVWIRALRALGYKVNVIGVRGLSRTIKSGAVLITEGVRPTLLGAVLRPLYRCWVAVAMSPAILSPAVRALYRLPDVVASVSSLVRELVNSASVVLYPAPPELEALLKLTDHDMKNPWVCYSGVFIPIKGLHMVPYIALRLKNEGVRARIVLIGGLQDEPMWRLVASKARRLGVEDYVTLVERVPRAFLFRLLRKCAVYLQPALFDAFPLSVVEAMALGLVPVVTKYVGSGDLVELIDKSLVRRPQPDDIAEALMRLMTDERILREYSRPSKDVVKNALSFEAVKSRISALVEMCMRR